MAEKQRGKIKFFNDRKNFGYVIDKSGKEMRFTKDSCLTPPINYENVVYYLKSNGRQLEISQMEGEFSYYFKDVVFRLDDRNYDEFCDKAMEYAKKLKAGDVTTSMIRKVYSQVIRAKSIMNIKHLRPQLAYIAGRNSDKPRIGELMHILDHLAKQAKANGEQETEQLDNIKQFMEAIVAYLKYVGE